MCIELYDCRVCTLSFYILLNSSDLELLRSETNCLLCAAAIDCHLNHMLNCVCLRAAPTSALTANSGANWLKYGAVRAANTADGNTSVEFEPSSHSTRVRKSTRSPSLFVALLKTFIKYFAFSGVLLLGFDLVIFVNPFLLK